MWELVRFEAEIILTKHDVFDVAARYEEAMERAGAAGEAELAFLIEGLRRFLLGRLIGDASPLDG